MVETTSEQLLGCTVAVTAQRRAQEFSSLLQRQGAQVLQGPAISIVPLIQSSHMYQLTHDILATPPDIVVITSALGFRSWMVAAYAWGIGEQLHHVLENTLLIARGSKAIGALHAEGLHATWSHIPEFSHDILHELLEMGVEDKKIVVQLHGAIGHWSDEEGMGQEHSDTSKTPGLTLTRDHHFINEWNPLQLLIQGLTQARAQVVEMPVYRWTFPEDIMPISAVIEAVCNRTVDALTFTSPPAVIFFLRRAQELKVYEQLLEIVATEVLVACIGPATAAPWQKIGVPVVYPQRYRLGALARVMAEEMKNRGIRLGCQGHDMIVRAQHVLVDGQLRKLSPTSMAMLKILLSHLGAVTSREELSQVLPGEKNDNHALDTAMGRLREQLAIPGLIQTVIKRGYTLKVEEQSP